MNRQEWTEIAKAIGALRAKVAASASPKELAGLHAFVKHDRKLIRGAKLQMLDECARVICRVLKARSSRFDGARFLAMIRSDDDDA